MNGEGNSRKRREEELIAIIVVFLVIGAVMLFGLRDLDRTQMFALFGAEADSPAEAAEQADAVREPTASPTPTLTPIAAAISDVTETADELELQGIGEPGSEIEIILDGEVIGTASVGPNGKWNWAFNADPGEHRLEVRNAGGSVGADGTREVQVLGPPTPTAEATASPVPSATPTAARTSTPTNEPTVTPLPLPSEEPAAEPNVCADPENLGQQEGSTWLVGECASMARIAQQLGIDLRAFIDANPQLADPNIIHPGEVLNLP